MFIQSCFSFTSKALHFPHHLPSIILSLTISFFFLPLFALFIGFLHLHSLVYIGVKILSFPLHFVDLFVQFRSPSFFFAIIRSFSPCHILSFLFFFYSFYFVFSGFSFLTFDLTNFSFFNFLLFLFLLPFSFLFLTFTLSFSLFSFALSVSSFFRSLFFLAPSLFLSPSLFSSFFRFTLFFSFSPFSLTFGLFLLSCLFHSLFYSLACFLTHVYRFL